MAWRLALTIVMSLAAGMAGLPFGDVSAAPPPQVAARLQARARTSGRVRVIVGHRAAHQPERALSSDAAIADQRARHAEAVRAIVSSVRTGIIEPVWEKTFETLPFFTAEVDAAALAEIAASPLVGSIDEDVPRRLALSQSVPLIQGPDAWNAGYSGAGWTVAILDTGVDSGHPFLTGKVVSEACYSTTDASGGTSSTSLCPGGMMATTSSGTALPCSSTIVGCEHGTHVAGIATGSGPTFSGVARDAGIVSIQVFSRFSGSDCGGMSGCVLAWDSDVIAGLDRVYALRNSFSIASVNLSLGSSGVFTSTCDSASTSMTAAIGQLRDAGIATVIAAGNTQSTSGLSYPACISTAVSVGSTTKSDVVSTFSNTSAFLSFLAPGEPINSSVPGGGFASMMGTSMAAPHVAGAWAVMKQRKPTATVDEVLAALQTTGLAVVDARAGSGRSFPRIRVKAALDALKVSDPEMAVDSPANGALGRSFALAGWAVDRGAATGAGTDAVHVWAYPADDTPPVFVGTAVLGGRRDDVAAVFGAQFDYAGFNLNVTGLASGSYTLVVYAHSSVTGTFNQWRQVSVTVPSSSPAMSLDAPANSATVSRPFRLAGWAVDRAAADGTGIDAIHVWAFPTNGGDPIFIGPATYGTARTDVGAAFGHQFDNCGFVLDVTALGPGDYDLAVYAHSSVTGTFNQARVVRVTIR